MKALYNSVEECLIKNIINENVLFVFSTDVVKNSWIDWVITSSKETGVNSVSLERFLAWDNFKSEYISSSKVGYTAIPSILRKLFSANLILRNQQKPFLKKIINPDYRENSSSFTDWISSILPSLELWHSRWEKNPDSQDLENQDLLELYNQYKAFLEKNNMFEPSWIIPSFENDKVQIIIIYPEILEDYVNYIDSFEKCPNIFTLNLPADYKKQNVKAYRFSDSRQELRRTILHIRDIVESGKCDWNDITLSVADLELYKPYLEREFEKYCIPFVIRAASSLTKNCPGQIFVEMANCEKFDFNYASVRTLLLDEYIPWKGCEKLYEEGKFVEEDSAKSEEISFIKESLIREGQRLKCLCGYNDALGKKIDIWEKALSGVKEDELELTFYKALKKDVKAICNSGSFKEIQQNWYIFKNKYLDESEFSTEANQILGRCLTELKEMIEIEENYSGVNDLSIENHFQFYISELNSKMYAKQNKTIGVNVYPYRLSASAKYKYQFLLDASQKNMELTIKRLSFLGREKRKALGCYEEDKNLNPSSAFLWLYNSNNLHDQVQISYAENTFNGFAIPHTFLDVIENPKSERVEIFPLSELDKKDFYLQEQNLFSDHKDNSSSEDEELYLTQNQKNQFEHWMENLSLEEDKEYSDFLKGKIKEYLVDKRSEGWAKSAEKQNLKADKEDAIIISQSDMKMFFPCQRKWLFSKILKLEEDTLSVSLMNKYDIGNINHKILELFFKHYKKEGLYLPITKYSDKGNCYFDNEEEIKALLSDFISEAIYKTIENEVNIPLVDVMLKSQKKQFQENIMNFLYNFCVYDENKKSAFGNFTVFSVESWSAGLSLDKKIKYTGKLDVVFADNEGELFIVDFKTGKTPSIKECIAEKESEEVDSLMILADFQIPMYITIFNAGKNAAQEAQNAFFYSVNDQKLVPVVSNPDKKIGKSSVSLKDYLSTLEVFDRYAHVFEVKINMCDFDPKSSEDKPYNRVDEFITCNDCGYKGICRTCYSIQNRPLN